MTVLILSKTTSPTFIYWVGLGQPTWAPKPTPTLTNKDK